MKKFPSAALLGALIVVVLTSGRAFGATTVFSDNFTAGNSAGFTATTGVNNSIATRLTGTLSGVGLRYLQTVTTKPTTAYGINGNALRITTDSNIGRFTLSADGTTPFDFASALGTATATPANPIVYDIKISMRNDATSAARFSFGLATAEGDITTMDFGIQLYRAASGNTFYTIAKRFDTNSIGVVDVNATMGTTGANTAGTAFIPFLIRITDAGTESTAYSSRVQVSTNNGASWMYDSDTDSTDLPNGFRFDATGRYFLFDVAGNTSGSVYYDDFSVALQPVWNGGAADNNWSTGANWTGGTPASGNDVVFAGSTRLTPNMENDYSVNNLTFFSNAGAFSIGATAGKTLTLTGEIVQNSTAVQTLNIPLSVAGTCTIRTTGGDLVLGGVISGAGGIFKSPVQNNLTFSALNTYTGATTIQRGNVFFNSIENVNGGASAFGAPTTAGNGTISIGQGNGGVTFRYSGTGHTTDRVINLAGTTGAPQIYANGTGPLVFTSAFTATGNGAKTLTLRGTSTANNTIGGAIVNSSSATALTKNDSGKWILGGANTYTGATTVTLGTLLVNGSTASGSAVTVAAAATLGGTGTINGVVTNSGTLSAGASVGKLTTGALTLNSNATNVFEISSATGTAGVHWDLVDAGGNDVNVQSTSGSTFKFRLISLGLENFNYDTSYAWLAIAGVVQNFSADKFSVNDIGFTNDLAGGTFSIGANGSGLNVDFTPNQSPVAGATNVSFGKGWPSQVSIAELLADRTSDSDGDSRALVAVISTNAIVSTNGTHITITTSSETESIAYVVKDVRNYRAGDTVRMATNYIEITLTNRTGQTIDFSALANKTYGAADFAVSAIASSGLPVSFSIVSGPATILSGTNVHLIGVVGDVTVRASQAGNENYNSATNVDQTFSVGKAALSVTANYTNVYGAEPLLTVSFSGFIGADNAGNSLIGEPSLITTATTNSPVGGSPYVINVAVGTLESDNYDFVTVDGNITVIPAPLTVTANTNRLYGASNPILVPEFIGFVNNEDESVLSGSPDLWTTAETNSAVGDYTITVEAGDLVATNYTINLTNGILTVLPAPLVITPDSTNRIFGEANPTFTGNIVGLQNEDNITVTYDTTATEESPAGDYPITQTIVDPGIKVGNYVVTTNDGILTVINTSQTINFGSLADKTYGDADFGLSATASSELPVSFSIFSGPAAIIGGTNVHLTGAGTVVVRASQSGNEEFDPAPDVDRSFSVGKATLQVSAHNTNVYGAVPILTPSYSGFVNDDDAGSSLTGVPTLITTATTNSPVAGNPYTISVGVGTLDSSSYDFVAADGTLTMIPATLTVTTDNTNRLYGASNPEFTASYSGFVNNEGISEVTGSPVLFSAANTNSSVTGSPYIITVTQGTLAAANYMFVLIEGALTIEKVTLTVIAGDTNRVYGAADPAFAASYSGFVNGDDESVLTGAPSLTTSADSTSPVDDYTIASAVGTLAAANYTFNFVNGTMGITKAPLTVTADDKSRAYGASDPTFTASFSGFVNSETDAVISGVPDFLTTATTNSSVAGNPYVITPSLGSLMTDNYAFTSFVDGSLNVTGAVITVTADNTNRVYGASNPTFTASYSGFVNGEDEGILSGSASLTTAADETSGAGSHTINAAVGNLEADNYTFSFVDGILSVTKAPLTVTADDKSRAYGASDPTFTASFSGFLNSETDAMINGVPDFTTAATTNSSVAGSPYAITPSLGSLMADNYDFVTFVEGELTVTAATLTVTADNQSKTYGDANPTLTAGYIGFVNGENATALTGSANLTMAVDTNSTVTGSPYTITAAVGTLAADNYSFSFVNGVLAVTPAALTITSDSTNRVYGVLNPTFTGSISGLQNADDITAGYSTAATPSSPVGNYDILQTLNDSGSKLPNYTVTTNNGMLTISRAFLTVTSDSTNRIYGATDPAFTGSIIGLENGDDITANYNVAATTNSFVGSYVIAQTFNDPGTKLENYNVTTNNGSLSVTVAPLTVFVNSTNRAVGSTNPIFTGSIVGILNNDDVTANYTSAADTNSPIGVYDIFPEFQDPDGKLVNYLVSTNLGVLAVDGAPMIVVQPSNLIVGAGSNAVFTVTAAGSSLLYQWRKDGIDLTDGGNISGATTANLTLSTLAMIDSATGYSVFITNSAGSLSSSVVSLTVINPPSIIIAPTSRTNIAGTTTTFTVTSGGDEPLHYQWRFGGVDLSGEIFSSLSIFNVQVANAGNYTVVITNPVGAITSSPAILSVHYSLQTSTGFGGTVSRLPDQTSYAPGATVDLTATPDIGFIFTGWSGDATGTSNPLSVSMTTNKNITANFMGPGGEIIIDNDDAAGRVEFEGFWYTLDYINPHYGVDYRYASPGTNLVTARATYRPEIVRPGNYDVYLFYPERPIVRTTNAQWVVSYDGGNVLLGLDQHTNGGRWFQIASDKAFVAGTNQFVQVSNNTGETETNAWVMADAVKFVYSAAQGTTPTFITQPQSQTVNQTSNVTFTVQASGTGTLAYQWRFNDTPISGATGTSYTRTNVQAVDAGFYTVVVIHDGGSAVSSNAVLGVNLPPTITTQPANKIIIAGQPVTFGVTATGTAPFAYQWQLNSNNISGATSSSYTMAHAFATNAGYYSVIISNVASVVTSTNALLTVNPDILIPTVSFSYPSIGGKVANGVINMTGAAKDAIGVAQVKYIFVGTTNTATGTTVWSAPLTLTPGTNIVIAWSIDLSGNESARKTNRFYYNSTNVLTLNLVGNGQVSSLTNGQGLLVGRTYSATASVGAGTNYVFSNWTGTVASTNKILSFVMQSNMVLTANFISNPFSPVAGKYNGLFSETSGVTHASAGFFTMTLSSKASYTGKLLLDGNTLPISGKFDLSGQTARAVSRSKFGKSTINLALALDWSTTNETVHGTISNGVWMAELMADRATFDVNFNPTTNFLGRYTAIIPEPTNAPTDAPGGYGYLLVTNSRAGVITISQGALADSTVISQKVPMSKFGQWPLYVPAYKAITRYTNGLVVTTNINELRGSLIGWVTFTNNPSRTLAGRVNWLKSVLSPTNVYYASGFATGAELIASSYVAPTSGNKLLNLDYARVIFADGNIVLSATNMIFIQNNNVPIIVSTDDVLKVSFDSKIGLLKGSFAHPDNTNKITSFFGAVLQQQNYGAGAFRGTNESGSVWLGN